MPEPVVDLITAIVTLVLIMDPIGNVPIFLAYLKDVDEARRARVVLRESLIALAILVVFLFFGPVLLVWLRVGQSALYLSGGVLLFLISLEMIFPGARRLSGGGKSRPEGEPFIVPLATPLLAGPSTIATLMVFVTRQPERLWEWLVALIVAWSITAVILTLSPRLSRRLGRRGLVACERLMGMILTIIAVQMFLDGIRYFLVTLRP